MKTGCAMLITVLLGTSVSAQARRLPTKRDGSGVATQESPFFCNVKALSPSARARHFDEVGPALRSLKTGVTELPNGYAFQFPPDPATVALVAEWAAGERVCCPFFDIDLRFDREGGPLWLTLTGREGTKEFLKVDAAAWIK